jgi:hypothetical protein
MIELSLDSIVFAICPYKIIAITLFINKAVELKNSRNTGITK